MSSEEGTFEAIYGYADQPESRLLTRDSQFLAGSLAKLFTDVALVTALLNEVLKEEPDIQEDTDKLEEAVKSKLQKPLSSYLHANDPIWAGQMPPWADTVTLHQLLTHTSGQE